MLEEALKGKGSQEQVKVSETPLTPTVKNTKLHNLSIYAEDLVKYHAGSMIASSSVVSLFEPCIVDSAACVFVMFLTPLASALLPPPLLLGSPSSA